MEGATHKTVDTNGWVSYWQGEPHWDTYATEWKCGKHCIYLGGEQRNREQVSPEAASMSMEKVS